MRTRQISVLVVAGWLLSATPAMADPPVNDAFDQAMALGDAPVEVTGNNVGASRETGEPMGGVQTVWYAFRPTTPQRIAVEVEADDFSERVIGVFTGQAVAALQPVAGAAGSQARVAFEPVAGETYRIAVGRTYSSGPFALRIRSMPLPANDAFDDAVTLPVPAVHAGNLADATSELGERGASHSVWYRFRPRRSGRLTLDATGTCGGVTVYSGNSVDDLRKLANGASIRFRARRGRIYHAAVDCDAPGFGDYEVRLSDGSAAGDGAELAVDAGQTVDSVRSRGLRLSVSAARSVEIAIQVRVSKSTARRLGLDSRVLGRLRGELTAGRVLPAAVRFTRQARRALEGASSLNATVRLELPESPVPERFVVVPVTL